MPGARRRVLHFMGTFCGIPQEELRSSARRMLQRELGPLTDSGTTIFDNSKVGKFTPITLGRLRFAWGSDGMDYYKFCSSMLSSTVDLQGELYQAPGNCGIDSRSREIGCGRMDLRETGRTNRGKRRYSHRVEFWQAQAS